MTAMLLLLFLSLAAALDCPDSDSEHCADEIAIHIPDCQTLDVDRVARDAALQTLHT